MGSSAPPERAGGASGTQYSEQIAICQVGIDFNGKLCQLGRLLFAQNIVCVLMVLEKAVAPHSSTLAWEIPWMEEPGRLQSMGSLRIGHD